MLLFAEDSHKKITFSPHGERVLHAADLNSSYIYARCFIIQTDMANAMFGWAPRNCTQTLSSEVSVTAMRKGCKCK
jgi:hypothetical protein